MLNNNSSSMSGGSGDELKTQFMTREGCYRLMAQADYSRPNRVGYCSTTGGQVSGSGIGGSQGGVGQGSGSQGGNPSGAPVKVSFALPGTSFDNSQSVEDRIAFNFGREIFVYPYKGLKKAADLTKPLDKRLYKGTCPTCHDFGPPVSTGSGVVNPDMDSGSVSETGSTVLSNSSPSPQTAGTPLLVGFSGGQIQLIDPVRKELSKLFNEERHIEKTRVTCIKWVPTTSGSSSNHFLVSYSSGCMYVYNHELPCAPTTHAPVYQLFKQGQGYAVYTCKTKTTRNPLYKWAVGEAVGGNLSSSSNANSQASFAGSSSINEFAFSPCGHYLAVASQDGYLRVFNYDTMELVGSARSYFGGLLCVCWSPDGKYIGVGGEDDLITLYSMAEKRVVARGQGHKSWVSVVAFDRYNMSYGELPDGLDFSGSDEESVPPENGTSQQPGNRAHTSIRRKMSSSSSRRGSSFNSGSHDKVTCYRFGSVGQDTNLCLWDITEETLRMSKGEACNSASAGGVSSHNHKMSNSHSVTSKDSGIQLLQSDSGAATGGPGSESGKTSSSTSSSMSLSHRLASLNLTGGGGGGTGGGSGEKSGGGSVRGTLKATLLRGGSDKQSSSGGSSPSLLNKNTAHDGRGSSSGGGGGFPGGYQVRLGSAQCPRIHDVPVIEPLVNKKISHERLTALVFKEECLVTACQDGYVCTWARPGRTSSSTNASNSNNANNANLPSASSSTKCPSSPQPGGGGGTVV